MANNQYDMAGYNFSTPEYLFIHNALFSLSFPFLPCIFASYDYDNIDTFFRLLKNEKATSTKMWLLQFLL